MKTATYSCITSRQRLVILLLDLVPGADWWQNKAYLLHQPSQRGALIGKKSDVGTGFSSFGHYRLGGA